MWLCFCLFGWFTFSFFFPLLLLLFFNIVFLKIQSLLQIFNLCFLVFVVNFVHVKTQSSVPNFTWEWDYWLDWIPIRITADFSIETLQARRVKEGNERERETDPASYQFLKCSPPSGTHRDSQSWVEKRRGREETEDTW